MTNLHRPRGVAAAISCIVLASALASGAAYAAAPEAAFESAFQTFNTALAGNESAIDKAADAFNALLAADPTNPVLMAYAGAATSMKANTTMLPWKKMSYSDEGLAQIDKALAMLTPANDAPIQHGTSGTLEVKFTAANTFLAVPGFMNRGARGAKLLNEVLASPLFAGSPLGFKGTVWLRAAQLAIKEQRTDDAKKFLNEIIAQNAPQADAAKAKLKELAQ
jgi:tetratricopeptide (TPR) repeat protein